MGGLGGQPGDPPGGRLSGSGELPVPTHGLRIHITGVVQGVGFRPFVYGLAQRLELTGWVRNTSAGVDIEVDGAPQALRQFAEALASESPPLARIDSIAVSERPSDGFTSFEIIPSTPKLLRQTIKECQRLFRVVGGPQQPDRLARSTESDRHFGA